MNRYLEYFIYLFLRSLAKQGFLSECLLSSQSNQSQSYKNKLRVDKYLDPLVSGYYSEL